MLPEDLCERIHDAVLALPALYGAKEAPSELGLCLFYQLGERSAHAPSGRIVAVAASVNGRDRFDRRLRDVFSGTRAQSHLRYYIGRGLLRSENPDHPCLAHWRPTGDACRRCASIEDQVSRLLDTTFSYRCVVVEEPVLRRRLERALIATLSLCESCQPSPAWLGSKVDDWSVRASGLWNREHVFDHALLATEADLATLERLTTRTQQRLWPERVAAVPAQA